MYVKVEKPKANKSKAIAYSVGQRQSSKMHKLGFVDNRKEGKQFSDAKKRPTIVFQQPVQRNEIDAKKYALRNIDKLKELNITINTNEDNWAMEALMTLLKQNHEQIFKELFEELIKGVPAYTSTNDLHLGDIHTQFDTLGGSGFGDYIFKKFGLSWYINKDVDEEESKMQEDIPDVPASFVSGGITFNRSEKRGEMLIYENGIKSNKAGGAHITIHEPIMNIRDWKKDIHEIHARYYISKRASVGVTLVAGNVTAETGITSDVEASSFVKQLALDCYNALNG